MASRNSRNKVVIIFKDCPTHTSSSRFVSSRSVQPETIIDYVDSLRVLQSYIPRQIGYDTIVIPAWHGYAEIMHRNQAIEDNYYLLEAGDTVLFTYRQNLRPHVQSLHSEYNTWRYNIFEEDPRAVQHTTGYGTNTVCNRHEYRVMWWALNNPKYKDDPAKQELLDKYRKICPNIDSLQTVLHAYKADYAQRLDTLLKGGYITSHYADYLRGMHCTKEVRRNPRCVLASDSLMHYPFAHHLDPGLYGKDSTFIAAFSRDTTLSIHARTSALRQLLQLYDSRASNDTIRACRYIYKDLTGENIYIPEVIVGKAVNENGYTADMVFEDMKGRRHDYIDILREHRGKVIYIDFWASWCGPCVGGMPDALRLRKEYAGKDVVFLYLAVNDKRDEWLDAVAKYKTGDAGGINYMVLNGEECKFLKEINNRRIPHMILYDREGKLVNTDAPRPEDVKLKRMIDELL